MKRSDNQRSTISSLSGKPSQVSPLCFADNNEELVKAIKLGHVGASAILYERYCEHIKRVLLRILGMDAELPDILNEVFFQALKSIGNLKNPEALKSWLTQIAVLTARKVIDRRKRGKWLTFLSSEEQITSTLYEDCPPETRALLKAVDHVLSKMKTDDRIVFCLKYIDGMTNDELAVACNVSKATIKRRILKCKQRFRVLSSRCELLTEELNRSPKWRVQ